ncbi:MAG: 5'/3'-nucleotidase SurE [Clostridiales bacterium]|nr:5'/3'-nucleotidase SurE [Clostridiales bacterium]
MRILFTNDDGYNSVGLHAVADLFKSEHDIAVIAPDVQKSAASHSLTLRPNILKYKKVDGYDYKVFAVGGSPVDCVKSAVSLLFKKPDLIISGINNGENLGSDIWYSGTVSAASDGAHLGYRSIALSLDNMHATEDDFKACALFIKNNFDLLMSIQLPPKSLLNINFPKDKPLGVKVTKMNTQTTFVDEYEFLDENTINPIGRRDYSDIHDDNDEYWCKHGYITITPLLPDRTDYSALKKIGEDGFLL